MEIAPGQIYRNKNQKYANGEMCYKYVCLFSDTDDLWSFMEFGELRKGLYLGTNRIREFNKKEIEEYMEYVSTI